MNAVGIDISKGKSVVCIMQPLGKVLIKPFTIHHTLTGFNRLLLTLQTLEGETRIVMEHTGRYYEPLAKLLTAANFFVSVVNPKLIKDFSINSLRKVKTDKADSKKIARYTLDRCNELRQYDDMDTLRHNLKVFTRQFDFQMKHKIAAKNNLIALIDQTFPNINTLFKSPVRDDGSQKWVDFVATFWHADCIRKLSLEKFTNRYKDWCKKNGYLFQADKPQEIYEAAKDSICTLDKNALTKMIVLSTIKQFNAISQTVEELRIEMNELAKELPEYEVVMQMTGVGTTIAPQLIAEIGDVTRFQTRNSLTAFAGVDPGCNQSGKFESQSEKTSKRGSPHLRKALFQIMDVLIKTQPQDDAVFNFIDKKRSEGKPYYVYMTAGANKFLRIYYGRVKEFLQSRENSD